jgi:hypothetical protein
MKIQTPTDRILIAKKILGLTILVVCAVSLFAYTYPVGIDWVDTFGRMPQIWQDPYVDNEFTSPPWIMLLLPYAWLPMRWSNAINMTLNLSFLFLLIRKFNGGWLSFALTFTSPLFFDLLRTNNVDWIPIAALFLPPSWGILLLAIKPQVFSNVILIWWKQAKFRLTIFLPLASMLILSVLVWGNWFAQTGLPLHSNYWNFAPFPLGIPFGIYILYKAWGNNDEVLAAVSTPLFFPYIAPYSLTSVLALLSVRHRKEAIFVYAAFWFYVIIETRRLGAG